MSQERDAWADNARALLIVLVTLGHTIEMVPKKPFPLQFLYVAIYSFHMPAFVFLAGMFARATPGPKEFVRNITQVLVPYLIFETLLSSYLGYLAGKWPEISPFTPNWLMWFFLSLFFWRALLPFAAVVRWALPISVGLAVFAGYVADIGYFLSLSRTIVFFPFFLAGHQVGLAEGSRDRGWWAKAVAAAIIAGMAWWLWQKGGLFNMRWLWGSYGYGTKPTFELGRYRFYQYLVTGGLALAFLEWVPRRRFAWTSLGSRTVYAYLLHGFVLKAAAHFGLFKRSFETKDAMLWLVVLGTGLGAALASESVQRAFRWLVEPNLGPLLRIPVEAGPAIPDGHDGVERGDTAEASPTAGPGAVP